MPTQHDILALVWSPVFLPAAVMVIAPVCVGAAWLRARRRRRLRQLSEVERMLQD